MASKKRERGKEATTVSIIGAGRLGAALGIALAARGFRLEEVVARHLPHARKAARLIGPNTRALSSAQLEKLKPASILFITTPDDAIEETARQLATSIAWDGRGRIALHASGALSSESLHSLRVKGFHTGSMHPLISVSEPLKGAHALAQAHYCIEGHAQAVKHARTLIRKLGGRSFSINIEDKALYHAAAVISSGHMVALFDIAAGMLTRCGLTDKESRAALLPLILSTLENLSRHPPAQALTGAFARADVATVSKHLDALRRLQSRDALAAYLLLGQRSLELAKKNKADAQALRKIALALAEQEKESPAKAQRRKGKTQRKHAR
jgi:predicted short-subunit dehydrogenase-like oxidoreductase (DUF2520 family)